MKTERFNQRKENFTRALALLEKQSKREDFADENIAATLHFFGTAFELAWKLLKDFLEIQGINAKSPRDAIKYAYQSGYITDGGLWLEMLDARNSTSHMYEADMAIQLFSSIKEQFIAPLATLRDLSCTE